MKDMLEKPLKHVGPPPAELARTGRMNPEGIVVLYVAMDSDTARAELRPAIGNDVAVIRLHTLRPLKVLDMGRLETVTAAGSLSHFQPDYEDQLMRHAFLRRLHRLISQPVVPGNESDYLITQAMAEYLAYVHTEHFDGIKFSSAQKVGGTNIVLFKQHRPFPGSNAEGFSVDYVPDSIEFSRAVAVNYSHEPLTYFEREDGELVIHQSYASEYDDLD